MKPKALLEIKAALNINAQGQNIAVYSSQETLTISIESFAFLKQLPISKRAALGLVRSYSRHLKQEVKFKKNKKAFVSFYRGKFKILHWGLALRALFS